MPEGLSPIEAGNHAGQVGDDYSIGSLLLILATVLTLQQPGLPS